MKRPALLACIALAPLVHAQDDVKCNPGGTQLELDRCAADEFRQADDELNRTYAQAIASLAEQPFALAKLRAAQRLWITSRDADLEAQFPLQPGRSAFESMGSMYPMLYDFAKARLTRSRTEWLRTQILELDAQ